MASVKEKTELKIIFVHRAGFESSSLLNASSDLVPAFKGKIFLMEKKKAVHIYAN